MRQNASNRMPPLFAPPRQSSCAVGHGADLSQKSPIYRAGVEGDNCAPGGNGPFSCFFGSTLRQDVKKPPHGRLVRWLGHSGAAGLSRPRPTGYRGVTVILGGRRGPSPHAPCRSRRGNPRRRTVARAPAPRRSNGSSHAPLGQAGGARQPGRVPPRQR